MGSWTRSTLKFLALLPSARKNPNGVLSGYKDLVRQDVLRWTGLYVQPVIDEIDQSDDASITDPRIHEFIDNTLTTRDALPPVTAVFRIKNASAFLYLSVSSFVPLCREIIIVDNESTDDSRDIAKRLIAEYSNIARIRLFTYKASLAKPGNNYSALVRTSPGSSLAAYYNFAFSNATGEYVIKADAHTLLVPFGVSEIQEAILSEADVIYNTGIEVFGRRIDLEPRIYRRSLNAVYVDGERWEYLSGDFSDRRRVYLTKPVFLHLKALLFARSNPSGGRLGSMDLYGLGNSTTSGIQSTRAIDET